MQVKLEHLFLLIGLILCDSCSNEPKKSSQNKVRPENNLFTRMQPEETGIEFKNTVENKEDFNIFRYRNFYNGAGVGIGDINNDGLPDIFLPSNMGQNKLFLNKGHFKFEDITEKSGIGINKKWSTGVSMVDINNDGLLDIYVSNAGNIEGHNRKNELFINNGNETFTEAATDYGLDEDGFTTHTAFFDYDSDGDLDVYILNNSFIPVSSLGYTNKRDRRSEDWDMPEIFKGGGDKLLRNDDGEFTDVSEEAGIYGSLIGFGLGVTVGDVNNDQLPDLYISNDFYERDYLYINQGDGTFKEDLQSRISHLSLSSMGADMADINNDGLPEIFVTDMLPEKDERLKNTSDFERFDLYKLKENKGFYHQFMQNTLQLNNGDNTFSEIAFYSGVAETDWSWGALIFDMDNDGFKDIFVSNGIYHDLTNQDFMDFFANDILQEMVLTGKKKEFDSILNEMPSTPISNYAFKNSGDLKFENTTKAWGLEDPGFSNGSAYGDLDGDGDLDLIVNNVNGEPLIYKNNSEKSGYNYLKVGLKGDKKNRFAIGSKVFVYTEDRRYMQELIPSRGFQSSIDYQLTFGIGETDKIDSLQVIWPDKKTQVFRDIAMNKFIEITYKNPEKTFEPASRQSNSFLEEIDHNLEAHKEDNYIDYDYESLTHTMLSREGPSIAIADVNGDANDDIFIGGAKNQPASVYLQRNNASFRKMNIPAFEEDKNFEDTAAEFADVNRDGHPDLIVGSGGNFSNSASSNFATRVYLNSGNGNFELSENKISSTGHNTSVILAHDYDKDGDIDLFIGSRNVPGVYGINPDHQLLENDGSGNFKDITEAKAYEILDAGMITDAAWADIDKDNQKELIITTDWGTPKIYKAPGDGLIPMETNLKNYSGAWSSLSTGDVNNDGLPDLILGNRGTNSFYNPEDENPVRVYINDFDDNGTIEQIFTHPINGKDVPIHLRRELAGQISSVKKQNLKYSEYATKSIDELFSKEILKNSIIKKNSHFKSMIAYNQGNGNFKLEELPAKAQFSSIHAALHLPQKNGKNKLLLAGNEFDLKPQFSRLDGNHGLLLNFDKNGNYIENRQEVLDFFQHKQVRSLKTFTNAKGEKFIIAGINNETSKILKIKE